MITPLNNINIIKLDLRGNNLSIYSLYYYLERIQMRIIILLFSLLIYSHAVKPYALQFTGVKVKHEYSNGKKEKYLIERIVNSKCMNISVSVDNFKDKNISENIPNECKKTVIKSKGIIQPLFINEKIKTYSEIELMNFLYTKSSKDPLNYVLVDSRKKSWFDFRTIPSSVNVPFEDLKYDEDFEADFNKAYKNLGIKVVNNKQFDFTNAKTAIFFCNGPWCPVSTKSIKYLSSIGYPENKLIWYRGGMSSWESLSLSVTSALK
jgi:rhodanese-related sulfurtransferase